MLILMAALGHSDFRVREAAHGALVKRGPQALPALAAGQKHADAEIAARCRVLYLIIWAKQPIEIKLADAAKLRPRGWNRLPWTEATQSPCWRPFCTINGWVRLWTFSIDESVTPKLVAEAVASGHPLYAIQGMLDRMAVEEAFWWDENRCWLPARRERN
jgi:hypothetical protein